MKNLDLSLGDVVLWQPHPSFPAEICMVVGGVEDGAAIILKETKTGKIPVKCTSLGEYVEVLFTSDGVREWVPVNTLKFVIGAKSGNKR